MASAGGQAGGGSENNNNNVSSSSLSETSEEDEVVVMTTKVNSHQQEPEDADESGTNDEETDGIAGVGVAVGAGRGGGGQPASRKSDVESGEAKEENHYNSPAFTNQRRTITHSGHQHEEYSSTNPFALLTSVTTDGPTSTNSHQQSKTFTLRPSKLIKGAAPPLPTSPPTITITAPPAPAEKTILRPPRLLTSTPLITSTSVPPAAEEDLTPSRMFVPLLKQDDNVAKATTHKAAAATAATGNDFLFGQNLSQRVVKSEQSPIEQEKVVATTNTRKRKHSRDDEEDEVIKQGPPAEEEILITGEEGESNVLQVHCKLFTYNGSNALTSWIERGRGLLRLNDKSCGATPDNLTAAPSEKLESRVIVRTKGSLRVMLNTKVWNGMVIEKPNEKSVRFTGFDDDGAVKIFLVMASPGEMDLLYNALECRIRSLKEQE